MLSVIIPAYNEEENIVPAADAIGTVLRDAGIGYELIFVNDGSTDGSWRVIQTLSETDLTVRGLCFSRNFGKESAIFAGLSAARGDCCVVIDCDLQHPPEKIVEMYRLWEQGFEVIEGVKASRGKESAGYGLAARVFYRLISKSTGLDLMNASDFRLLDRKAIDSLLSMGEQHAFFRALSSWIGFRTATVEFDVQSRNAGQTKWTTRALVRYALTNITSFTTAPMQLITVMGVITLIVSVIMGVVALYQKFSGVALGGFTTVIILQLFTGSLVMMSLGIIGHYLAKIYDELKARPRYIVSDCCGKIQEDKP